MPARARIVTLLSLALLCGSLAGCGDTASRLVKRATTEDSPDTSTKALLLRPSDLPKSWTHDFDDPDAWNLDEAVLSCLAEVDLVPDDHVAGPNLYDGDERLMYTFADRWDDPDARGRVRQAATTSVPACLARDWGGAKVEQQAIRPPITGFDPVRVRMPDGTSMALGVTCVDADCLWVQFAPALHDVPAKELAHALDRARARHEAFDAPQ